MNQQVLSFVVLLLPLIGMQNPSPSVVGRSSGTSVLLLFESITNLFDLRNSDPGLRVVFPQRPNSDLNSVFAI